jgi:hypothetical protein
MEGRLGNMPPSWSTNSKALSGRPGDSATIPAPPAVGSQADGSAGLGSTRTLRVAKVRRVTSSPASATRTRTLSEPPGAAGRTTPQAPVASASITTTTATSDREHMAAGLSHVEIHPPFDDAVLTTASAASRPMARRPRDGQVLRRVQAGAWECCWFRHRYPRCWETNESGFGTSRPGRPASPVRAGAGCRRRAGRRLGGRRGLLQGRLFRRAP